MDIFTGIEKWITEHGSAAILDQQLAFAKDQFSALERKVSEFQIQIGKIEAQLEREELDHRKAASELQKLKEEHAEDVRLYDGFEFRKGKRTGGKWLLFCPKCHLPIVPAYYSGRYQGICSSACGWRGADIKNNVEYLVAQIEAGAA